MEQSKFSDSQIMAALKKAEARIAVPDICRELDISMATFYKWRPKYRGMDISMMARMKEQEEENRRLCELYMDKKPKAEIVAEALEKVLRPSQRREMACEALTTSGLPTGCSGSQAHTAGGGL